jgi:putative ABC transport system permease protein
MRSPASVPRVDGVRLDGAAILFTVIVSIATALLFGVAPALRFSRPDLSGTLREGGRSEGSSRRGVRVRRSLVVAQIALAVVLVIGSGLLIRSFAGLRAIEPGFDSNHLLTAQIALPTASYPANADVVDFYARLTERLRELPGVVGVGAARVLPLSRTIGDWSITVEGQDRAPGENPNGDWQVVVPGYFETMGLRLLEGRFLTATDRTDTQPVVVLNRTMASAYWAAGEALGKRFRIGDERTPWFTIVGIVDDVKRNNLTETPRNEMYHAHSQFGLASGGSPRRMTLVLRTAGDPLALAPALRQVVLEMNPDLPVSDLRTMQSVMDDAVSDTRFTALLLTLFAGLALVLAAVGVYGVVSYGVNRRTREFGIRIALGARSGQVVRLAVADSVPLVLGGVGAGVLLALVATRLLSTLLYGVGRLDPLTFLSVPLALGAIALLASFVPALRASGTDPLTALRTE